VLHDARKSLPPAEDYTEAMRALYLYETERVIENKVAETVFGIRESSKQSEILEALLIGECPYEEIQVALSVPIKASQWYAELYFDVTVFRTVLDKIVYLEEYDIPWARDLKMKSVNLGYEFVLFTYANIVPKTEAQKKLVERMFMATAYKAMSMNYNGINSSVNKQAVKHAELMLKAYDLLVKTNADEGAGSYDLVHLLTADMSEPDTKKELPMVEIV